MRAWTASRLAWVTFGLVALGLLGNLIPSVLRLASGGAPEGEVLAQAALGLALFSFPVVGVLIASRQPRNAIGWLLLGIGFVWEVVGGLGHAYVRYGLVMQPGSPTGQAAAGALASSIWVPGLGLIGTFLILLFPDGRLPARGWRPWAWLCGLTLTVMWISVTFAPGNLRDLTNDPSMPDVANPLGIEALRAFLSGPFYAVLALLPICFLGSALSLIIRFRRSHGRKRQQLKWLAAAAGVAAALFLLSVVASLVSGQAQETSPNQPFWLTFLDTVAFSSFVLIPVAVGIAVLRHRLYDIDLIINRALVYGLLTAALAVVYVGGVVGIGRVMQGITNQSSNNLAVAASTLAVAALFGPLHRRVQAFIDRRFYRHKYDAEQTVADFSSRLRDQVDLESLKVELVGVVSRTMQPSRVSLWLKGGE
jgi:hypothetical protein